MVNAKCVIKNLRSTRRITNRRTVRQRHSQTLPDKTEETTTARNEIETETDADYVGSKRESVCAVVQNRKVSLVVPVTV